MKNDNDFTKEVGQKDVAQVNEPKKGGDFIPSILMYLLALIIVSWGSFNNNLSLAIMGVVIMLSAINITLREIAQNMKSK